MERNSRNHGDYLVIAVMLDSDKLGRSTDRDNKIRPLATDHDVKLLYDGILRACTVEESLRDFLTSIGFCEIFADLRN